MNTGLLIFVVAVVNVLSFKIKKICNFKNFLDRQKCAQWIKKFCDPPASGISGRLDNCLTFCCIKNIHITTVY